MKLELDLEEFNSSLNFWFKVSHLWFIAVETTLSIVNKKLSYLSKVNYFPVHFSYIINFDWIVETFFSDFLLKLLEKYK